MLDKTPTPHETLIRARQIALSAGLNYVYLGNVVDPSRESTHCPECGYVVVGRNRYTITGYSIGGNGGCAACGSGIAGVFEPTPGNWGPRRQAVRFKDLQQAPQST